MFLNHTVEKNNNYIIVIDDITYSTDTEIAVLLFPVSHIMNHTNYFQMIYENKYPMCLGQLLIHKSGGHRERRHVNNVFLHYYIQMSTLLKLSLIFNM